MSALAEALDTYLTTRQHTLSTAHLSGFDQLLAEADYVFGEARELRDAVRELALLHDGSLRTEPERAVLWTHVRHEIADVVLAATTLAGMLPGDVTVEACIAEKTEADRGRG